VAKGKKKNERQRKTASEKKNGPEGGHGGARVQGWTGGEKLFRKMPEDEKKDARKKTQKKKTVQKKAGGLAALGSTKGVRVGGGREKGGERKKTAKPIFRESSITKGKGGFPHKEGGFRVLKKKRRNV